MINVSEYKSAAGKTVKLVENTELDRHYTVVEGEITLYSRGQMTCGAANEEFALDFIRGV